MTPTLSERILGEHLSVTGGGEGGGAHFTEVLEEGALNEGPVYRPGEQVCAYIYIYTCIFIYICTNICIHAYIVDVDVV